jgi:hypothetical protein
MISENFFLAASVTVTLISLVASLMSILLQIQRDSALPPHASTAIGPAAFLLRERAGTSIASKAGPDGPDHGICSGRAYC